MIETIFQILIIVVAVVLGIFYQITAFKNADNTRDYFQNALFCETLIYLSSAILRLKNDYIHIEFEYLKKYLRKEQNFQLTKVYLKYFLPDSNINVNVELVCKKFKSQSHTSKLQILYQLFKISSIDKEITKDEEDMLIFISKKLGMSDRIFQKIKIKFVIPEKEKRSETHYQSFLDFENPLKKDLSYSYSILGVCENSSNEDIKKAYYRLAKQYHPDKMEKYGEKLKNEAKQKFIEINQAYEIIKEERNIK